MTQMCSRERLHSTGGSVWEEVTQDLREGSSCRGSVVNESKNHEVAGLIPGLAQWVEDQVLPWAVV